MFKHVPLIARVVAAIVGGYALAVLLSVAALALPVAPSERVFIGMMASFLAYTGAVIWVFAVRSAARAWVGLLAAAVVLLPAASWVWYGGAI